MVAENLHISMKHYSEIERGISGISIDLIIDMASYYNVTIDYLLLRQTNNIEMGAEYSKKYEQLLEKVKNKIADIVKIMIDFCYEEQST